MTFWGPSDYEPLAFVYDTTRRDHGFENVRQMLPFMRMAYCNQVHVLLDVYGEAQRVRIADLCDAVFGDLRLPDVAVGHLQIAMDNCCAGIMNRKWLVESQSGSYFGQSYSN